MTNLLRALKVTFRHKLTIFLSLFCAICLALCWGGNITAVYPLVQISFQGETVGQWLDKKVQESENILEGKDATGAAVSVQQDARTVELKRIQAEKVLQWCHWAKPYVDRYAPSDPFMTVVYLMMFVVAGTLIKSVFAFCHGLLSSRIGQLGSLELREVFFEKLLNYEVNHFNSRGVSDAMSRFTGDMGSLSNGLSLFYGKLVREPMKMLACIVGAIIVSWQLFLFTCLFLPLVAILIRWMAMTLKRVVRNSMIEMVNMYSRIDETFRSIRVVKAFNREDYEQKKFSDTNRAVYRRGMKSAKYGSLTSPLTECLGTIMMIAAVLVGAYLVMYEKTTIFGIPMASRPLDLGSLILFYGFLIGAADPARRLSDFFIQIQSAVAAADRVYEMIDREVPVKDPEHPKTLGKFSQSLVYDHVSYSYMKYEPGGVVPDRERWHFSSLWRKKSRISSQSVTQGKERVVLKDISLEFKFGETIAIVGPSGCGKSTLLNLIPRFYDPTEGRVLMDGIPLPELAMREIRDQIGLVTQETALFNDTVFENIRYGVPNATREQVIDAARKAYAHDFIMEDLAQGYETNVGPGGGQLSGGQRQRIALARAILKDPRILLLDEATSQIDIRSEQYIHDAIRDFVGNRTTIIVTHRLTAIRLADRIIAMQDGVVEGIGTHDELLKTSPFYASLWEMEGSII
ncbi:MAG: ABC transporter ATP-binding protein [Planctomycetia bacterium]|nr:ABC transporter ATP-binding protein [Planctomycetia bacterium]